LNCENLFSRPRISRSPNSQQFLITEGQRAEYASNVQDGIFAGFSGSFLKIGVFGGFELPADGTISGLMLIGNSFGFLNGSKVLFQGQQASRRLGEEALVEHLPNPSAWRFVYSC
jgi:hypothetical protein